MKHRTRTVFLLCILALCVLAGCTAAKGSVKVKQGNALSKTVDLSTLTCEPVQGVTRDDAGETVSVDTTGVLVSDVLFAGDIDASWIGNVTVQARDKTTVEVTGSELNMANKAYLTSQDDGSWDLVILDTDGDGRTLQDVVFLHAENI